MKRNHPKPGRLRVVAGAHRGRKLVVPAGDAVRPTKDMAREAMFAALDARGAWVEPGRLKSDPGAPKSAGVIQSRTFIDNVRILCRFLAAGR